jgi:hypothetical protein
MLMATMLPGAPVGIAHLLVDTDVSLIGAAHTLVTDGLKQPS